MPLLLSRCPAVVAERGVALSCTTTVTGATTPTGESPLLPLVYKPASAASLSCDALVAPVAGAGVSAQVALSLLPSFRAPSASLQIACDLRAADGSGMGAAALNVSITATLWPTFDDVVVVASK